MIQSSLPSIRRPKVFALRDFPDGCGTQFIDRNQRNETVIEAAAVKSKTEENLFGFERVGVADQNYRRAKEDESVDLLMKKAGFGGSIVGIRRLVSAKRTFPPSSNSKVKPISSEETIELLASQSKRSHLSESLGNSQRKQIQRNLAEEMKNEARPILVTQPRNHIREVLSPREKVLKALRLFKIVYKELDQDKAARRGESKTSTSRIDYETLAVLKRMNKQVNGEKRIGSVPGIEVGDEFQYKTELNVIGLHFSIMGGIDYMNRGDLKLATSIVAAEGYGYTDRFESDVVIYTGQGGNMISNDQNMALAEDQKLVKGNLALANSMGAKTEVRVIRGIKRLDQKGKHFIYDGLYLVNDYWREKGPKGNTLFKFRLCRIPGQPSIDWKRYL